MTAQELFDKNKELYLESRSDGKSAIIDDFGKDFMEGLKVLIKASDEKWEKVVELFKQEFGGRSNLSNVNLFSLRQQAWENMEGEQMIDALRRMFE